MQLAEVKNNKLNSSLKIRKDILDFEAELSKLPGASLGDTDSCPLKHSFSDGMYIREMFIPKGRVLTGKIHKHEHPYFVLKGEIIVVTEREGKKTIKAPCSMISPPGTKRIIYAKEDTILVTIHHNPDNIRDLKKLENIIVSKDYLEYDTYLKQIENVKSRTNCGLEALKNLSSLESASMRTIVDMAEDNGLTLYPYAIEDGEQLMKIPLPAIVHSENHFDYISKKEDFDFKKEYTGYVLLTKKSDYKKIKTTELKKIIGETFILVSAGTLTTLGVAVISGGSAITAASIKAASDSKTECGSQCRSICKQKTSILFGGRKECKRKCKSDCMNALSPQEKEIARKADEKFEEEEKRANTLYVIGGIILAIALGLVLYVALKKK